MSIFRVSHFSLAEAFGWRSPIFPAFAGFAGLALAVIGAILIRGQGGTDGVNLFVGTLAGRSSSFLEDLGFLAPMGFAFAAGLVSAVNPCGFAMLPAYLGLYMGSKDQGMDAPHLGGHLGRALMVGGAVTAGFILLFGVTGAVIGLGARAIVGDVIPWFGLAVGVLLAVAGAWLLGGGKMYTGLAARAAAQMGNPGQVNMRGYFLFGLSYGTASLSCTLPFFLLAVGTTLAASTLLASLAQGLLYALGMGLVIIILTVGMALLKGAVMVQALRKCLPYIQPVGALLMIVAGSYIVFYWLTIGSLL